jgi:bis(5'-nucleosyl)-tetraphosphatase (symmetrical)
MATMSAGEDFCHTALDSNFQPLALMTLVIGDLQGCNGRLGALLHRADPHHEQSLWFCGDLVNRGPHSLQALQRVQALGDRAVAVLGNHDLHLLATSVGARKLHRHDTLTPILEHAERDALLTWLRHRPLAHFAQGHLMVHAGVLPQWDVQDCLALAEEVQAVLRGPHWGDFLGVMYGNQPDRWDPSLSGDDRLRLIVNAFTRLRFIAPDGAMDFTLKESAQSAPAGYLPWFEMAGRRTAQTPIIFGHWSTLGLILRPHLLALDTGCVWGGSLSAVRLEDREVFQVRCPRERDPAHF